MAKDRKVTQENKDFYRLGFSNGENRLQKTIEALKKANHHLWEALVRLDEEEPKGGVLIDYKTVDCIIRALGKRVPRPHLIRKIKAKEKAARATDKHHSLMSTLE